MYKVPCINLANLFWAICKLSKRESIGSDSLVLTFPYSWTPYLIFEVYRLSEILFNLSLLIDLANLLSRNNLEFRLLITPPLPWIWIFHFWLLSKTTPSNLALDSENIFSAPMLILRGFPARSHLEWKANSVKMDELLMSRLVSHVLFRVLISRI